MLIGPKCAKKKIQVKSLCEERKKILEWEGKTRKYVPNGS